MAAALEELPPWQTVYHVFRRWKGEGLWETLTCPTASIFNSFIEPIDPSL